MAKTWQPIKKFPQPAPNPKPVTHMPTPSNKIAAKVVRDAKGKGSVDPRQRHN